MRGRACGALRPTGRVRGLAALRQRPRARGRPRTASEGRESVGRLFPVPGVKITSTFQLHGARTVKKVPIPVRGPRVGQKK